MKASFERSILRTLRGAEVDVFDAVLHQGAEEVPCLVLLDTLELEGEFGVTVSESGARIGYLTSEVMPNLGDFFIFNGHRYLVENKEPTQDTKVRYVHCRVMPV